VQNEYAEKMEGVRDLEAFAAVVYSSNFEFESQGVEKVEGRKEGVSVGEKASLPAIGGITADDPFESAWGKAVVENPRRSG